MTWALILANVAVYVLISLPLSVAPADPADPAVKEYLRVMSEILSRHAGLREILASISQYDIFVFEHGFRPAAPSLANLFFSLFLHAGFLHLFGNMLFLWIYGDNVEHRLGHMRYLFWYLLTGVAATLFHAAFFRSSQLPLVGASGAISGVLGFYFLWFPRNRVRLLVLIVPFFMRTVDLSARLVLGVFLILDNLLPFLLARGDGTTGVAFGAHIGGFLAGLAAAWWMDQRQLLVPRDEYADGVTTAPTGSPVAAIKQALADRRMPVAARTYLGLDPHSSRGVLEPDESLQLADWLAQQGHARAALAVYLRHLRDYPNGPGAAEAQLGAGLVQLEQLDDPTAAYQHFLDSIDLNPSPQVAAQARAALARIAARQKLQVGRPLARREI
jgi:membrane associated rhomboid family serine protease